MSVPASEDSPPPTPGRRSADRTDASARTRQWRGIVGCLLLFAGLSLGHALAMPHLYPTDERAHLAYALSLSRGVLPTVTTPIPLAELEAATFKKNRHKNDIWVANHPPLHYALVAPVVRTFVERGAPKAAGRSARLVSVTAACAGLALVYLTALRALRRRDLALVTTALTALVPGFVHVMGSAYNDATSFLTVSAACYVTTRLVLGGMTWPRALALAATLSLAMLTRFSALFAVTVALLALAATPWLDGARDRKRWSRALGASALVLSLVLATSGWFYWRNYRLYGDVTGARMLFTMFQRVPRGSALAALFSEAPLTEVHDQLWEMMARSHHARGGGLVGGLITASGVGLAAVAAARRLTSILRHSAPRPRRSGLVLAALAALLFALYAYSIAAFYSRGGSAYARYLFPALPVAACVVAVGFDALHTRLADSRWPAALAVVSLVLVDLAAQSSLLRQAHKLKSGSFVLASSLSKAGIAHPALVAYALYSMVALGLVWLLEALLAPAPPASETPHSGTT